jgi:hypothetical protein
MSQGQGGGRPLKFKTVEELEKKGKAYFAMVDKQRQKEDVFIPYTITGLANFLDTDRCVLVDYGNKQKYSSTIKRLKSKVEEQLDQHLYGNNVTGLIFNLKNNFGWKDRTEQNLNVTGELITKMTDLKNKHD